MSSYEFLVDEFYLKTADQRLPTVSRHLKGYTKGTRKTVDANGCIFIGLAIYGIATAMVGNGQKSQQ